MKSLLLSTLCSLLVSLPASADKQAGHLARNWKSNDGKIMPGELLEFTAQEVRIKRTADFQIVKLPLDRLSEEDRAYILGMVHELDKDAALTKGSYAAQVTGKYTKGTSKEGLLYQMYADPKWDGKKRYPVVIFLHGSGQSGNDNEKQMGGPTTEFTKAENQSARPCFVVVPQCPDSAIGWNKEVATNLVALVADLTDKLPVDADRIYLTGSSMGGFAAWNLPVRFPHVFACAVPVCGGGDPKNAVALKQLPVWAWHGDLDDMVPIERDRVMVAALKAIDGNVKFTELTGQGHGINGTVYASKEMHEWMFAQRRLKDG